MELFNHLTIINLINCDCSAIGIVILKRVRSQRQFLVLGVRLKAVVFVFTGNVLPQENVKANIGISDVREPG